MLNINRILQQDRLLRATRLNQKAFEELLVKFELVYLSTIQEREKARKRNVNLLWIMEFLFGGSIENISFYQS